MFNINKKPAVATNFNETHTVALCRNHILGQKCLSKTSKFLNRNSKAKGYIKHRFKSNSTILPNLKYLQEINKK